MVLQQKPREKIIADSIYAGVSRNNGLNMSPISPKCLEAVPSRCLQILGFRSVLTSLSPRELDAINPWNNEQHNKEITHQASALILADDCDGTFLSRSESPRQMERIGIRSKRNTRLLSRTKYRRVLHKHLEA